MNQLTTKDAIQNLQNLINAGLRGGLFQEPNAVFAVQASLDMLKQIVETMPERTSESKSLNNGVTKQEEAVVAQ